MPTSDPQNPSSRGSFWSNIPPTLQAIAAIIGAIAVLVGALAAGGALSSSDAVPAKGAANSDQQQNPVVDPVFNRRAVITSTRGLFLRDRPSWQSAQLERIRPDQPFHVGNQVGAWWSARLANGRTGWVHATDITVLDAEPVHNYDMQNVTNAVEGPP